MECPFFSILLPVYNGEKYLDKLLSSLDKQKYKNFEVIVCDDASSDASFEKLSIWAENTSLTVHLQKNSFNQGVGLTQFKNFQASSGKYLILAAQDHIWHEDRLQEIIRQINTTNCKLVFSAYKKLKKNNENGTVIFPISNLIKLSKTTLLIFRSDLIPLDTVTLHRSLMDNYADCIEFTPVEDLALVLDAMRRSTDEKWVWTCINRPLIEKINHQNNLSKVFAEVVFEKLNEVTLKFEKNKMMVTIVKATGYIVLFSKVSILHSLKRIKHINPILLILGGALVFFRIFLRFATKLQFSAGFIKAYHSQTLKKSSD